MTLQPQWPGLRAVTDDTLPYVSRSRILGSVWISPECELWNVSACSYTDVQLVTGRGDAR